jgi:hypothetical protein
MLVNSMCGWFRFEQQQEQHCHDKRSTCLVQPEASSIVQAQQFR